MGQYQLNHCTCPFKARHAPPELTKTCHCQIHHIHMSIYSQTLTNWIHQDMSMSDSSYPHVPSWTDTHLLDSPRHVNVRFIISTCPFMARHSPAGFSKTCQCQIHHIHMSIHGQTLTSCICQDMSMSDSSSIHGQTLTDWIHQDMSTSDSSYPPVHSWPDTHPLDLPRHVIVSPITLTCLFTADTHKLESPSADLREFHLVPIMCICSKTLTV